MWLCYNNILQRGFAGYPELLSHSTPQTNAYENYEAIQPHWESFRWFPPMHYMEDPKDTAKATIEDKWKSLNGAPGAAISYVEEIEPGYRIRYQNGAIYTKKARGPAYWVYGAINEKYHALGGVGSWLGWPVTDELPIKYDEGKVSGFEHGEIYWWPGTGAIEIDQVVLTYKGIHCFDPTSGPGSDEVYATISVAAPTGMANEPVNVSTSLTKLYTDVDKGESFPDHIELYRGKPYGLNITFVLMEHDEGDPNKYYQTVHSTVSTAAAAATSGVAALGGPLVGGAAAPILKALVTPVAKGINSLLGTGDDLIGQSTIVLPLKDLVQLSARPNEYVLKNQIPYKIETPPLTGQGSSYKGYFSLSRA